MEDEARDNNNGYEAVAEQIVSDSVNAAASLETALGAINAFTEAVGLIQLAVEAIDNRKEAAISEFDAWLQEQFGLLPGEGSPKGINLATLLMEFQSEEGEENPFQQFIYRMIDTYMLSVAGKEGANPFRVHIDAAIEEIQTAHEQAIRGGGGEGKLLGIQPAHMRAIHGAGEEGTLVGIAPAHKKAITQIENTGTSFLNRLGEAVRSTVRSMIGEIAAAVAARIGSGSGIDPGAGVAGDTGPSGVNGGGR